MTLEIIKTTSEFRNKYFKKDQKLQISSVCVWQGGGGGGGVGRLAKEWVRKKHFLVN